jgi:hypothetical protein
MCRVNSLSAPYKHLYEIRGIKKIVYNKTTNEIHSIDLTEPLMNSYPDSTEYRIFYDTHKILFMHRDCPPNILDLLSLDELRKILNDREFDNICQSMMKPAPQLMTRIIYDDFDKIIQRADEIWDVEDNFVDEKI